MARKAPKVVDACDRCGQEQPARYRTLFDAYLCPACYDELCGTRPLPDDAVPLEWPSHE